MITRRFDIAVEGASDAPYDFAAIESLDEFKQVASDARIIIAVDTNGQAGMSIVYGKELLRAIAAEVIPEQDNADVVSFALDFETDQYEKLCAAVQVTKGFHEAS